MAADETHKEKIGLFMCYCLCVCIMNMVYPAKQSYGGLKVWTQKNDRTGRPFESPAELSYQNVLEILGI